MLAVESVFEDPKPMSAMYTNGIPGYISRRKKRKPHDVIPMHMRHKKIIEPGLPGAVILHHLLPQTAQTGTHIAHCVVFTTHDFHACRVAAVTMPDGKIQLPVDKLLESGFAIESSAVRLSQGLFDSLPGVFAFRRYRKGSSRSPEPYLHRSSKKFTPLGIGESLFIPVRRG